MAELLRKFEAGVEDDAGNGHWARVLGAERGDGKWVGWVEFVPLDGGETVRTGHETTQRNARDVAYWAGGLTASYMEGALRRARYARPVAVEAGARAHPDAAPSAHPAPGTSLPRLDVRSVDGGVVAAVMGARDVRPGTARVVPDAGVVVYEGPHQTTEGEVHRFALQSGSPTATATLSNWLWSRLHGTAGKAWIDGEETPLTNDGIRRRLVARRSP